MLGWLFKREKSRIDNDTPLVREKRFDDPDRAIRIFESISGMDMRGKEGILKEKLANFCNNHDICSFEELEERVHTSGHIKDLFISYLTVNETFFFRESAQIDFMLEKIKSSNAREVSILSLPCASGEEPYSIAIKMQDALPLVKREIIGIDISPAAIEKARKASYSSRSVSNIPLDILKRYFREDEGIFLLESSISQSVRFLSGNIFEKNSAVGSFDYIFCRNLFIYFDEETKQKAVHALSAYLKPKGVLFLGHADTLNSKEPALVKHLENGVLCYSRL